MLLERYIPKFRHLSSFQRKMLAIYLHHDHSVLTNVFCTQALCADSVVSFLSANFVTFGYILQHLSSCSITLRK